MDKIRRGKIVVGSTLKALNYAKMYGKLDLKYLYLFYIVSELQADCHVDVNYETYNILDKILRDLQSKYPSICNYNTKNKVKTFISGKKHKNLNVISEVNNKPTVLQDGCLTYENVEYTFTVSDLTQNYSDPNGDTAKYLKIISLPDTGTLTYNGEEVIVNQIILLSDISNLIYYFENPFFLEVATSFNYQIGDSGEYTKFSDTDTFNICADAVENRAPLVSNLEYIFDEDLCVQFSQEDFENSFSDVDGHLPDNVKFTTLISGIPNIQVEPDSWNPLFAFEDLIFPIEESDSRNICVPDAPVGTSWKIVDNHLVQYDTPDIEQELIDCANDGYIVDSIDPDYTYNLSKTVTEQITSTANIYAFIDTSSFFEADGANIITELQEWFNNYSVANPEYEGELYIIPTTTKRWVQYGAVPQTGSITVDSSGNWGNIQNIPPNFNTLGWAPDNDAIVIGFVDDANPDYHSNLLSDGFTNPVQPTAAYTSDLTVFEAVYGSYNFFRGIIYPIIRNLGDGEESEAAVLQAVAAIEGDVVTQATIDSYNTLVDISPLLSSNPYNGVSALKDLNWIGIVDKIHPESDILNPKVVSAESFEIEIEDFLENYAQTTTVTKTIDALNDYESVVINFEISDNHPTNPLYSNSGTITMTFFSENQLPSFGDGSININANEDIVFTRNNFTVELDPIYFDADGDPAYQLEILSLPQEGELQYNKVAVTIGDKILFEDIEDNEFEYIAPNESTLDEVTFTFNIIDEGSL